MSDEGTNFNEVFDSVNEFVETMTGLRNGLIAQGFGGDVAEAIVLDHLKIYIAQMQLEAAQAQAQAKPRLSDLFGGMGRG